MSWQLLYLEVLRTHHFKQRKKVPSFCHPERKGFYFSCVGREHTNLSHETCIVDVFSKLQWADPMKAQDRLKLPSQSSILTLSV